MENIPIEDFMEDIIGKAMRGRSISQTCLSEQSGVTSNQINLLLEGRFNEEAVRAVAPHLELDADALVDSGRNAWYPEPVFLEGLAIFNTRWHDMRVNAFVVFDPMSREAAVFDTGADCDPILEYVRKEELNVSAIYLTHTHGDHIADLDELTTKLANPHVFVNPREDIGVGTAIDEGDSYGIGALKLQTFHTSGHSVGGTTYFIEGLARPVAIVGDALFAGSMGGGMISFADALENNRRKIFTLPDDTVICPGHGPMSTVGEEKAHNPFYPEFK